MRTTANFIGASLLALATLSGPVVTEAAAQPSQGSSVSAAIEHYNLPRSRLAIDGYDPVAYFPEGGGKAVKGSKKRTLEHHGLTYRFASDANRGRFQADPDKYRPAYGGWCAWAMTTGDRTDINPKTFKISADGRLLLFYNGLLGNTRKQWGDRDAALLPKADGAWRTMSGEAAHFGKGHAMQDATGPLNQQLGEFQSRWSEQADPQTKAVYERGIEQVGASGVLQSALRPGAQSPRFALPDASGTPVSSSSLLANGPIVVTFYRGGWCPYCNLQLRSYQERLADFRKHDAQLVAISPEMPDGSLSTKEKNELSFHVLRDPVAPIA
ncbi:MAG: YHS domain-containing (seleno)protein, partial [Planctomycetota bacterium]